ncbi:MAG TPA: hypothetical protein PKI11_12135 [Candidatus Hydrogenedentes bacterium]|nr:hypothetical protein [Candidatus Hydrogenedentota bacterium]
MHKRTLRPWVARHGVFCGVMLLCAVGGAVFLYGYTDVLCGEKRFPYCLSPAVLWASGRGLWAPDGIYPPLHGFVTQEQPSVDAEAVRNIGTAPLTDFHACHQYLLYLVGAAWRVFGISWGVFRLVLLLFFCATAAALYGVFRLGMNRWVSAMATLLCMFSPGMLAALFNLRDYSRAFFAFAAIALLGLMVKHGVTRSRVLGGAALLGLVVGLGLGFRQDILTCIPPALFVMLCLAPSVAPLRYYWRVAAVALFFCVIVLSSFPILVAIRQFGPTTSHHIIGGFAVGLEDHLGVGRASYQHLALCDDRYIHATTSSYARRALDASEPVAFLSPEAAKVGDRYVLAMAAAFPADMLARGYAGVLRILRGPGQDGYPSLLHDPMSRTVWRIERMLGAGGGAVLCGLAGIALVLLGLSNTRHAWAVLICVLYFCSYISLQFQLRHCFHLFFIPLWLAGYAVNRAHDGVRSLCEESRRGTLRSNLETARSAWRAPAKRLATFAGCAVALVVVPFSGARAVQDARVARMNQELSVASLEELVTELVIEDRRALVRPIVPVTDMNLMQDPDEVPDWLFHDAYLVAVFDASQRARSLRVRYDQDEGGNEFTTSLVIGPTGNDPSRETRVFFPVYETLGARKKGSMGGWIRFAGIEMRQADLGSFRGLYRVAEARRFPLWLEWCVPGDPDRFIPHQAVCTRP